MKIGYARVSTKDQNLSRQIEQLTSAGVEKIFKEKVSGKNIKDRYELKKLLSYAREGDKVVVLSLDRLGRNYEDIKEIFELLKKKQVGVEVLDAPFLNFNTGNQLLDTAMQDMFLSLLSYIAEAEREKIRERQRQGIEIAKAKGIYKGRPRDYSSTSTNPQKRVVYQQIITEFEKGHSISQIARDNGVSRNTVYKIIKEKNNQKGSIENEYN